MKAYLLISHLRIHNANAMRKEGAGSGGDTTCKNSGIISQDESADL